jgi:hypothetical protein
MASKVNTRFVIILAAALVVLVGGVAGLAVFVSSRSGASYVAKGDAKMAEGDYTAAESFYSIAVNKEQQNVPWLLKWIEALSKKVPANEVVFRDDFRMYLNAHRALAVAKKTDVQAHRNYLDILLNATLASGGGREAWSSLRTEAKRLHPLLRRVGRHGVARAAALPRARGDGDGRRGHGNQGRRRRRGQGGPGGRPRGRPG